MQMLDKESDSGPFEGRAWEDPSLSPPPRREVYYAPCHGNQLATVKEAQAPSGTAAPPFILAPPSTSSTYPDNADDIESRLFTRLVKQWHEERGITSSLSKMFNCSSYQQIIEMGDRAVPLILERLKQEGENPDHWYAALEAITGEDPVPEDAYGDTVLIAKAWLSWAETKECAVFGHIPKFRT